MNVSFVSDLDMPTRSSLFVTGGTGFVGSHFLHRVLEQGGHVTALARGDGASHARARLVAAASAAASAYDEPLAPYPGTLHAVHGDITAPVCGLEPAEIGRLRGRIHEVWHLAACLKYEDEHKDEIQRHNVDGTAHALDLAEALGVRRFVYFSTAYTAGAREGLIEEGPVPPGTRHNNCYEATKAFAEAMVARRCDAATIDWRVLRPSIVIGPRSTHRTGGSSTGFYGFIREVLRLREGLAGQDRLVTLTGEPTLPLDLVPVDSVVADMIAAWQGSLWNQRFRHLTAPDALALGEIIRVICETIGIRPLQLDPHHQPTSRLERLIDDRLDFYRSYFRTPKTFARSLPRPPALEPADIVRYTQAFVAEQAPARGHDLRAAPRPSDAATVHEPVAS